MNRQHAGWFRANTAQGGRTVREQMIGLAPALEAARGKRVLDLGCAEGWIGIEFIRAGAAAVDAADSNEAFVKDARSVAHEHGRGAMRVCRDDLNLGLPEWLSPPYDVVLALAILHKLQDPAGALAWVAAATGSLLVVRLPQGSQGEIAPKYGNVGACDLNTALPPLGLTLADTRHGPRQELVQYWRRA